MGAKTMWRCFEYERKTAKPTITAMLRMRRIVSRSEFTPAPKWEKRRETACEAKGHHELP
jgi:hypothetical protein